MRLDIHLHLENPFESPSHERIFKVLEALEEHLSKQDESIAAFEAKTNEKLAALGVALDNIAADEAKILKDLQDLNQNQELTRENQAKLDGVLATLSAAVQKSQALADSLPDAPATA